MRSFALLSLGEKIWIQILCDPQSPSVCPVFGFATNPGTYSLGRVLAKNFGYKFCVTHRVRPFVLFLVLPPHQELSTITGSPAPAVCARELQQPPATAILILLDVLGSPATAVFVRALRQPIAPAPFWLPASDTNFFSFFRPPATGAPDREGDHCNPGHNPEILASPARTHDKTQSHSPTKLFKTPTRTHLSFYVDNLTQTEEDVPPHTRIRACTAHRRAASVLCTCFGECR